MRVPIIILVFCSFACSNDRVTTKESEGFKSVVNEPKDSTIANPLFTIEKIDDRGERVFVVIDSNTVEDISRIRSVIEQVSKGTRFKADLNISFFTASNYADYKDEFEDSKGMVSRDYFSSYVGEYNKQTETYWTYPTSPIKKKKYSLK